MSTKEEVQDRIKSLSDSEVWEVYNWLGEYANERWDEEMERDAAAGRLDKLGKKAEEEYLAGRCFDLFERLEYERRVKAIADLFSPLSGFVGLLLFQFSVVGLYVCSLVLLLLHWPPTILSILIVTMATLILGGLWYMRLRYLPIYSLGDSVTEHSADE